MAKKIEDLVIVSYDKSVDLFLLQLKTLNTFLKPCTIHLVINETDIQFFYNKVRRDIANSKHNFIVYTRMSVIGHIDGILGWHAQQLIKLLMPIDRPFIVLDDKDLLIKHVELNDLTKSPPIKYLPVMTPDPPYYDVFSPFFKKAKRLLKSRKKLKVNPLITDLSINWTPAIIEPEVIEEILHLFQGPKGTTREDIKRSFSLWFFSGLADPSGGQPAEFMLYDLVRMQMKNAPKEKFEHGYMIWGWNEKEIRRISEDKITKDTHIYKCHNNIYKDPKLRPYIDTLIKNIINNSQKLG